jgi:hypothetical protein
MAWHPCQHYSCDIWGDYGGGFHQEVICGPLGPGKKNHLRVDNYDSSKRGTRSRVSADYQAVYWVTSFRQFSQYRFKTFTSLIIP